jgi:hypothetical protein
VGVLAIPNAAVASFAEVYRDRLAGAVIIDPSNPFVRHDDGMMTIHVGGKTSGMVAAELFPKSSVARAFSHQLAETLWLVIRPLLETPVTERTPFVPPRSDCPRRRVAPDGWESSSRSRGRSSGRTSAARQRVNIATT